MTSLAQNRRENGAARSAAIEKLRELVGEVGATPTMVSFEQLDALGLIESRPWPGGNWRYYVVAASVEAFAREQGYEFSGPYEGDDEEGGSYYLFAQPRPAVAWPHQILLKLPAGEQAAAERDYSAWLDRRGATFAIESYHNAGIVHVRLESADDASEFVMDHGGSWVGPKEAARLLEQPDLLTTEIYKPLRGPQDVQSLV